MEIGSEFWKKDNKYFSPNDTFYLCGRTAIEAIIKDAIENFGVSSVLMPSFCCYTMLEPIMRKVQIRFYDVAYDENGMLCIPEIPETRHHELIFVMTYFGSMSLKGLEELDISRWDCAVEDMTHNCFTNDYSSSATYSFASYRKWFAVDGVAIARKKNGKLKNPNRPHNDKFSKYRNKAFELKWQYMEGALCEKQKYLDYFAKAGEELRQDYSDRLPNINAIIELEKFNSSIEKVRRIRQQNAATLRDGLKDLECFIQPMVEFNDSEVCPLFFPIKVEEGHRDELRKFLISKNIYSPIHWPISELHKGISMNARTVYSTELSLVCDQRYSTFDMMRVVDSIHEYYDSVSNIDNLR